MLALNVLHLRHGSSNRSVYADSSNSCILAHIFVALLSVYDKTDLLLLAEGLHKAGVQLLGSGGTAKKIREAGIPIKYEITLFWYNDGVTKYLQGCIGYYKGS